jgi:hypothetical protein
MVTERAEVKKKLNPTQKYNYQSKKSVDLRVVTYGHVFSYQQYQRN